MSFSHTGIARLRIGIEPNGAYGVDLTDTISDLTDLRFMEATPVLPRTVLQDEATVQRFTQRRAQLFGFGKPTFELSSQFCGSGQVLNAAATPTQTTQSKVLAAILGGYSGSAAGTAYVSNVGAVVTVTAGHGTRFAPGSVCWIQTTAGIYEPNIVRANSADTITLTWLMTLTPTPAGVICNSQHCYLEDPAVSQTSLQALWETQNREEIFLLCGLQATGLSFDLTLETVAKWSAPLAGNRYLQDDAIATPQGGAAIGIATYDGGQPAVTQKGGLLFGPLASSTRSHICASEVTFTPGVTHSPVMCASADGGISQMYRGRADQSTLSFTALIEGTNLKDLCAARDAGTLYKALWYANGTPGNQKAVSMPTMQIVSAEQGGDVNGLRAMKITCALLENQDPSSPASSFERAPFQVAIS